MGNGPHHRQRPKECHTDFVLAVKNYLLMAKLPLGKHPERVADMVIGLLLPYRKNVLTITTDNGSEFACHKKIAKALASTVYFADSYASWQKGAIENQNKLIRQYIPKGTDFRELSESSSRKCSTKLIEDQGKNSTSPHQKKEFFKLIT